MSRCHSCSCREGPDIHTIPNTGTARFIYVTYMTQWNVPLRNQFDLEFILLLGFPWCMRSSFLAYFCCILPCCSISVVLISLCYFWLYLTYAGSKFFCRGLGLFHQQWLFYTSNSCRNAHEIPSRSHDLQMLTGGQNLNSGAGCWGWKSLGRAASMSLGFAFLPFLCGASDAL